MQGGRVVHGCYARGGTLRRPGRFVLAALLLPVLALLNWRHPAAFPGVLPAFTAKEHRSRRFVMGHDGARRSVPSPATRRPAGGDRFGLHPALTKGLP